MKTRFILPIVIAALALTVLTRLSNAQQVATDILDDVSIERADYNAVIKVTFKRPFRYISHSPTKSGNSINIKIDILDNNLTLNDQLIDNESIVVKNNKGTGLTEVDYERNGRNSKYLIFYFDKNVSFEVIQGSDQRSLSVVIYGLD